MVEIEIELSTSEKKLFDDLNKLRTEPKSFVDSFNLISKALVGIPSKKREGEELSKFTKTLSGVKNLEAVTMSPGLCNTAHDILMQITQFGTNYHEKLPIEEFHLINRKYVGGFKEIISITDIGSVESFFGRVVVSEHDKQGNYRKFIFSPQTCFCGVASVILNDEPFSVLILTDNIIEGPSKMDYFPENYPEFKAAFDLFDVSKNGKIDCANVKEMMRNLGYYNKAPVVFELISKLDNPQQLLGTDFNTFMNTLFFNINDKSKEGLLQIFRLYKDDPNSDSISLKELKKIATELNEKDLLEDVNDLIVLAKTDTVSMSFEEFSRFYNH